MGVNTYTSRLLWDALTSIVQANRIPKPSDLGPATARVRDALLAVGSETPDNVNLVKHIEFGAIADGSEPVTWLGPMISGKPILLSDIVWALEEEAIPPSVRESIPSLSEEEWSAAIRIIVLILTALERPVRETGTDTVNPFFADAPHHDDDIPAPQMTEPEPSPAATRDILDIERPVLTQYVETRHFADGAPRAEPDPVFYERPVVERPVAERENLVSTVRTHTERPVQVEREKREVAPPTERVPLKKKLVRLSDITPEKIDEMWNDGDRPSPQRRPPVARAPDRRDRDERSNADTERRYRTGDRQEIDEPEEFDRPERSRARHREEFEEPEDFDRADRSRVRHRDEFEEPDVFENPERRRTREPEVYERPEDFERIERYGAGDHPDIAPDDTEYLDDPRDYENDRDEPSEIEPTARSKTPEGEGMENAPRSMRGRKARRDVPDDDETEVEDLDLSLDDVRPGSINDIWDSREIDLGDAAKRYESYYNNKKPKNR